LIQNLNDNLKFIFLKRFRFSNSCTK